jgi:hypothetical protein
MAKASLNYNALTLNDLPNTFWDKVDKTDTCWLWTGKKDDGYGRFSFKGSQYLVHRAMFALYKESVEKKLVIDHTCKVRACCNPDHLRQITISENTKGHVHGKYKDICPNGHDLSGDDADVYFSMRKPRHGDLEVMHIICSICNYPQVFDGPDTLV